MVEKLLLMFLTTDATMSAVHPFSRTVLIPPACLDRCDKRLNEFRQDIAIVKHVHFIKFCFVCTLQTTKSSARLLRQSDTAVEETSGFATSTFLTPTALDPLHFRSASSELPDGARFAGMQSTMGHSFVASHPVTIRRVQGCHLPNLVQICSKLWPFAGNNTQTDFFGFICTRWMGSRFSNYEYATEY